MYEGLSDKIKGKWPLEKRHISDFARMVVENLPIIKNRRLMYIFRPNAASTINIDLFSC